jgi:thiol:disulfide interchange protein
VVLGAVGILSFKVLRDQRGLAVLDSAQVPGLTSAGYNTVDDPFPVTPKEQVQWVLRHQRSGMVLFHSNLCRPCRMMEALVQMVRRDYEPDVVFIEVIIDDPANAELLRWAKVGSIPASYFVSRSGEGKRVVGLMKQQDLRAELARLVAEGQSPEQAPIGLPLP